MKTQFLLAAGVVGVGLAVWAGLGLGGDPRAVPAPEFDGVTAWVNAKPFKVADQKGKVVVLHFWTNGCVNCVNNYPHYRGWQEKYKDATDFLLVGVHTPEFDAEKDVARIKQRMAKYKLTFAVAVDNDQATWKAWGNRYWPCVYVVDKAGNVRQKWEGELGDSGAKRLTALIDDLRKDK
jgi:thiol-disulfide isomerase/thioredoxin